MRHHMKHLQFGLNTFEDDQRAVCDAVGELKYKLEAFAEWYNIIDTEKQTLDR